MTKDLAKLSGFLHEPVIAAVAMLALVGLCLFVLVRIYWVWHKRNNLRKRGLEIPGRKLTLFDVRELLMKREKDGAVVVYRQIFKVDQKEAQKAVDALERNLHQQG